MPKSLCCWSRICAPWTECLSAFYTMSLAWAVKLGFLAIEGIPTELEGYSVAVWRLPWWLIILFGS